MSYIKRPMFYLWTITSEVVRLERLYPSYEVIAEKTELPPWENSMEVAGIFNRMMRQDKKHPIASFIRYRRMFVRIDQSFCEANPDWSKSLLNVFERVGSLYVEIATADNLAADCGPLGSQEISWPMSIRDATNYWRQ